MLYIAENIDKLGSDFLYRNRHLLSGERLQKIESYKFLSDKVSGCAVYLLLRYALKKEYNIDEAPKFIYGEKGKPYLLEYPKIYFNLSHCKNSAACIVSDTENAVDITDFRKVSERLPKRICTTEELSAFENISSAEDRKRFIIKLWSVKECCSKLTGKGLSEDFRSIDTFSKHIEIYYGEKYICTYTGFGKNILPEFVEFGFD